MSCNCNHRPDRQDKLPNELVDRCSMQGVWASGFIIVNSHKARQEESKTKTGQSDCLPGQPHQIASFQEKHDIPEMGAFVLNFWDARP